MAKKNTAQLLSQLDKKIKEVKDSKEFKEMLTFFSNFHNYSYHNSILIKMQKPDATYVAGYRQWQKKFDRNVKKGEEGIAILAPFTYKKKVNEDEEDEEKTTVTKTYFKPVYVFDISQTEGPTVPTLDISIENEYERLLKPLCEYTKKQGIKLEFKKLSEAHKGYSKGGKIVINSKANQTEKAAVLVHEIAHEFLHDKEKRVELSKEIKEMEAEAVAFVVMDHYDIDIKSDKYIALYKKSYDLRESLARISKLASDIIKFLDEKLIENKKVS